MTQALMLSRAAVLLLGWGVLAGNSAVSGPQCSVATLEGRYVFTGRGFIEPIEPGVERLHYGVFVFDGRGRMTGKQTSSRGGKIGRELLEGSYTVGADCSGTLRFRHVDQPGSRTYGPGVTISWDMYITQDGRTGHIMRTDEGTMAVRTFHR